MKKIILLSIVVLFYTSIFSQEHLKFKNIPINGDINDFAIELVNQGCTVLSCEKDIIILKGEFIGIKNCMISVLGTSKSHITSQVIVLLPKVSTWDSLKGDYLEIKDQYQAKYGTPTSSYSTFTTPYFEGDGFEMQALNVDKCSYATYWKIETSFICVKIESSEQIGIFYSDYQNNTIKETEKQELISNEI